MYLGGLVAWGGGLDQYDAKTFVDIFFVRMGEGVNEYVICQASVGDEHLRSVDNITSPFFSALVLIIVTSLPASGSVIPKPIMASPLTRGGRYFFFCSSVPKAWTISDPKVHERIACPHPGSTLQNSSDIRECSRNPKPAPPYSSLMKVPTKPFSEAFFHRAWSNSSFSSNSFARSLNSPSANSLAAFLMSTCSAVSSMICLPANFYLGLRLSPAWVVAPSSSKACRASPSRSLCELNQLPDSRFPMFFLPSSILTYPYGWQSVPSQTGSPPRQAKLPEPPPSCNSLSWVDSYRKPWGHDCEAVTRLVHSDVNAVLGAIRCVTRSLHGVSVLPASFLF